MSIDEKFFDSNIENNKNVNEFFLLANEFCLFVEEIENHKKQYILEYCQRVLPIIYLKASLLPELEIYDEYENERYVIEETWEYIYNITANLIGTENKYYNWNSNLNEPIEHTFSENIADLYQDLKDFVFLYSKSTIFAKNNAVANCLMLYKTRYGAIILNLLSYIHNLLYKSLNYTENEI